MGMDGMVSQGSHHGSLKVGGQSTGYISSGMVGQ
jgi:hypothetical protein